VITVLKHSSHPDGGVKTVVSGPRLIAVGVASDLRVMVKLIPVDIVIASDGTRREVGALKPTEILI
jgi:hypothetical protein